MSEFNSYAKRVDEIATNAFVQYKQAEAKFKKAEEQRRAYPVRNGINTAEYAAKSARAQADYLEAEQAFKQAKSHLVECESDIKNIRKELAAEIDKHYSADPSALDSNTMELLKAGILKPNEYSRLMQTAKENGNHTMARVIGKYASDAADAAKQRYGENSEQARALRAVSYAADEVGGQAQLDKFDYLSGVFHRTANNSGLIDHWGELTDQAISDF